MKNVLRQVRRLGGMAVNPLFKVDAIRKFVVRRIAATANAGQVRELADIFRAYTVSMQFEDYKNYPDLEAKHLDNPRLFANRKDLISSLSLPEGGVIAEIGVADGFFSDFLLSQLRPRKFVAFDLFTMHEITTSWDGRTEMFGNMTQLEHYRRKFADRGSQVVIEVGMSQQNLVKYPDKSFDLIYIDGDHSYTGVKQDANLAKIKIADNGIIVFNDYIIYDWFYGETYGVVRAVNELIINEDWRVCGFSLNWGMYCDIAVRKPCGPREQNLVG